LWPPPLRGHNNNNNDNNNDDEDRQTDDRRRHYVDDDDEMEGSYRVRHNHRLPAHVKIFVTQPKKEGDDREGLDLIDCIAAML